MNLKPSTVCVSLPEVYSRRKLNALYREIPLKDTTSRLLRKYFNAMANLYGIIPLRKAYEIISAQCRHPVSKEEFLSFSEIARHECEEYCLLGADELYPGRKQTAPLDREIIDITLVDGDLNAYHEMRHSQGGKPYYIPDRAELLAFDDPFYCEPTPAADALLQFMERCLRLKHDRAAALLAEFVYAARCLDAGISEVMARLEGLGIHFRHRRDAERFCTLYQEFHNHMRLQCNRGYTPEELLSVHLPAARVPKSLSLGPNIKKALADGTMDAASLEKGLLDSQFHNERLRQSLLREITVSDGKTVHSVKVGRNDLCPCGSGQKYKKCCGR